MFEELLNLRLWKFNKLGQLSFNYVIYIDSLWTVSFAIQDYYNHSYYQEITMGEVFNHSVVKILFTKKSFNVNDIISTDTVYV